MKFRVTEIELNARSGKHSGVLDDVNSHGFSRSEQSSVLHVCKRCGQPAMTWVVEKTSYLSDDSSLLRRSQFLPPESKG